MTPLSISDIEYIARLEQRVGRQTITIQVQQELIEKLRRAEKQSAVAETPELPKTTAPVDDITGWKRPPLHDVTNEPA